MTEFFFYHLERQSLEETLPVLLLKCQDRQWRSMVRRSSKEGVAALSELLWRFGENSFLAHACVDDEKMQAYAADQPIWITSNNDCPNGAHVLFLLDGTEVEDISAYTRVVYLFDGRNEESLEKSRSFWKTLKQKDVALSYWQQSAQGGWEQKA